MRLMRAALMVIGLGVTALGVGCAGGPEGMSRHDVVVSLAPELTAPGTTTPSIRVDVVAVNSTEAARWEQGSMSEYWSKSTSLRQSADKYDKIVFAPGNTAPKTLSKSDPIWTTWGAPDPTKKAGMQLFILADLPGSHDDLPGSQDDRRIVLPLDRSRWNGDEPIRITIQPTRLRCDTPPKEVKEKK